MKIPEKEGENSHFARDTSFEPMNSEIVRNALEIRKAVDDLCARLGLSESQMLKLLKEKGESISIPVSVFSNKNLSGLELICKYLKDELGIHFADIARLLSRDYRTVWTTYANASKKRKGRLHIPKSMYFVPTSILTDRRLSVLETIVSYLKDELGLRFTEIAAELHRDQRNIWTVYRRAKRKLATAGEESGKSEPEGEDGKIK